MTGPAHGVANATKFEVLLNEACDLQMRIARLSARPRLTAAAFIAESRKRAHTTEKRIAELDALLTGRDRNAYEACIRAVRVVCGLIRAGRIGRTPLDPGHFMGLYSQAPDRFIAELGQMRYSAGELFCICVRRTVEAHEDCFGNVTDLIGHAAALSDLNYEFQALTEKMETAWSGADVTVQRVGDRATLFFKKCPHLSPAHDDWPRLIVAHALSLSGVPGYASNEDDEKVASKRHAARLRAMEEHAARMAPAPVRQPAQSVYETFGSDAAVASISDSMRMV